MMIRHSLSGIAVAALLANGAGCIEFSDDKLADSAEAASGDTALVATPSYELYSLDTAGLGERFARFASDTASFAQIAPATAEARLPRLPFDIPQQGPAALHVQILLDRAGFSPGIIDGRWGDNAERALRWFRIANGLDSAGAAAAAAGGTRGATGATGAAPAGARDLPAADVPAKASSRPGASRSDTTARSGTANRSGRSRSTRGDTAGARVRGTDTSGTARQSRTQSAAAQASTSGGSTTRLDNATYQKLLTAAGNRPLIARYDVTAEDIAGPFVEIPDNVYEQAKLNCLCYSSARELLAERFHTSEEVLERLNPGVNLDSLAAGTSLAVPNVAGEPAAASARIAKLVVSRSEFWTHALDEAGNVVYHFPSTLGSAYDPSPTGAYTVTNVKLDPTFRYQPKLFSDVPDTKPEATLPAGPNSPVGAVWIGLSKEHMGIHGTRTPETIGYENSHGCVRLTNWSARQLAQQVTPRTPVEFVN